MSGVGQLKSVSDAYVLQLLMGYPPFWDETTYGTYKRIVSRKLKWPASLHPHAKVKPLHGSTPAPMQHVCCALSVQGLGALGDQYMHVLHIRACPSFRHKHAIQLLTPTQHTTQHQLIDHLALKVQQSAASPVASMLLMLVLVLVLRVCITCPAGPD